MQQLKTKWGKQIDKNSVLQEYPRPQLVRKSYLNLNGEWDYAISKSPIVKKYDGKILVPFAPEAPLSGVNHILHPDEYLHYRLLFDLPENFKNERIILHFGAVDQECEIFLNDQKIGNHKGGYLPFSFDITDSIFEQDKVLKVCVTDKTEYSPHARGKQKLHKKGTMDALFYTPVSGIWQTIWLESVSETYITQLMWTPQCDEKAIDLKIQTNKPSEHEQAIVKIFSQDEKITETIVETNQNTRIILDEILYWSPDTPHLYDVEIEFGRDNVQSYFGMRKFSKAKDKNGVERFYLNDKPIFFNGVLDQGYWPESLMTAPSEEALRYDIEKMKALGFNTIRKHVKIESERFYYLCDQLGMVVWQDMPNGGADIKKWFSMYLPNVSNYASRHIKDDHYKLLGRVDEAGRQQFMQDLSKMIEHLYNYPSIAMWIPFNEGWGQFDAQKATQLIKAKDETRLINQASGWFDQGEGDVYSIHNYLKKLKISPQENRAVALSEFGGYAYPVKNHLPADKEFGYKNYKSADELTLAYRELFETAILPNIASGLSAAIYTQIADIEEEINGLLTYDREVLKIDPEVIRNINRALDSVFESITVDPEKDDFKSQ